jgi:hypothetical protein
VFAREMAFGPAGNTPSRYTGAMPSHTQSPEAQWLAENYATESRPGAPFAGQWVIVQGARIVTGASSPSRSSPTCATITRTLRMSSSPG